MGDDSVAVRIAGHDYKIRSDGEPEALRDVARYVDRAMERVREKTRTVDTIDVAMLTCLNLAREILALHEERAPSGSTAIDDGKMRELIERVEISLRRAPVVGEGTQGAESAVGAERPDDEKAIFDSPRTLDLPSVEELRDRSAARGGASEVDAEEELPEARVAAGGRDRAS
ncbi:MAG: cell division protein ZapA [bacterium]|nr:cell division protein ZapA [bacterium]